MTTIYSYSTSGSYSTIYEAKNTASKAIIDNMAATTISDWTLVSTTSPTVSTSAAQTFSVTFLTSQGYRLLFSITTSTSADQYMFANLYTTTGTGIVALTQTPVVTVTNYSATASYAINQYYSASKYLIYVSIGYNSVGQPFGLIYLTDKASDMPDFLIFRYDNNTTFYTVGGIAYTTLIPATLITDSSTSKYQVQDTLLYYNLSPYTYKGKFLNTLTCNYGSSNVFARYNIDGVEYYRIAAGALFVKA